LFENLKPSNTGELYISLTKDKKYFHVSKKYKDGKSKSKCFSIKKYGDNAFSEAVKWRNENLSTEMHYYLSHREP
jgi:hypothetical protein